MTSIKQQILDLRKTTPKHVQWLLLAAAFVVVLILLTLMLGGKKDTSVQTTDADIPAQLILTPDISSVDWADTKIGVAREQIIKIAASAPVKILSVKPDKNVVGLTVPVMQTCTGMGEINSESSCTVTVKYMPTIGAPTQTSTLNIEWRRAEYPDEMKQTLPITLVLGAITPTVASAPQTPSITPAAVTPPAAPVPGPAPAAIPTPVEDFEYNDIEPVSYQDEILSDIGDIYPTNGGFIDDFSADYGGELQAETCSDYAFPGYDDNGIQIGWIKPDAGAYYFHPFSDVECDSPTGIYNPDNGIITDIKNTGKKIGTDAENIGYTTVLTSGTLPELSNAPNTPRRENRARQLTSAELAMRKGAGYAKLDIGVKTDPTKYKGSSFGQTVVSSMPYDRSFILRQYKPIPATIVSEILADRAALEEGLPVRATVDRNVYSDNGRTVIIPTGTLLLGYVTGDIPGPYKAIGRMNINWYQFILPNGVEFNFTAGNDPFSGDSQGRSGVPGRGSTDYLEQFVMPLLTAVVPAAVNMIAPISDKFINQIDLDNNTVVQSGTVRSSELAKNEIITAWNQVAQKLLVDMMDNTVPPFSIAAGTRITVYSPMDLMVTCGSPSDPANAGKECAVTEYGVNPRRDWKVLRTDGGAMRNYDYGDPSYTGQVRSFNWSQYCKDGTVNESMKEAIYQAGLSYSNVLFYCQSNQYKAINNAKQDAYFNDQQNQFQSQYDTMPTMGVSGNSILGDQAYNEEVLGMEYNDEGALMNPFEDIPFEDEAPALTCLDGSLPDGNGCCAGEIYTDMGDQGFNCCPETGGDCFPPIL